MKMVLLKPRAWRVASRSRPLPAVVRPLLWKIHQHKGWYCADDKSRGWSTPLVFLLPSLRWRMVGQPEFGPPSGRVVNVGSSARSPSRTERWGSRSRTGFTLASLTNYVCQEGVFGDLGRFGGLDQRACPVQAGHCGVAFFVWVGFTNAGCAGILGGFGDFNAFECGVIRQLSGCLGMRQGLPVSARSAVGFWPFVVGDVQEGRACALRGADLLPGWGSVSRAVLSTPMAYGGNFPLWYVYGHACPRTGACMPLDVALGSCR